MLCNLDLQGCNNLVLYKACSTMECSKVEECSRLVLSNLSASNKLGLYSHHRVLGMNKKVSDKAEVTDMILALDNLREYSNEVLGMEEAACNSLDLCKVNPEEECSKSGLYI